MNSFFFFLSELIVNRILIVFLIKLSIMNYYYYYYYYYYLCRIKKSTVLQICGLNEKTGSKSEIQWKMQLIQSNSFQ